MEIYASVKKRFLAYVIDVIISGIIVGIFSKLLTGIIDLFPIQWEQVFANMTMLEVTKWFIGYGLFLLALKPIYWAVCESSKWQATIGKKCMKIKVVQENGEKLSFWRALARGYARFISIGILYLGMFLPYFSTRKQALHDKISKTLVINEGQQISGPAPEQKRDMIGMWLFGFIYVITIGFLILFVCLFGGEMSYWFSKFYNDILCLK